MNGYLGIDVGNIQRKSAADGRERDNHCHCPAGIRDSAEASGICGTGYGDNLAGGEAGCGRDQRPLSGGSCPGQRNQLFRPDARTGSCGQKWKAGASDPSYGQISGWERRKWTPFTGRRYRESIHETAMNNMASGFLLCSLIWMKENEPENYSRTFQVLLPKGLYIRFRMCGRLGNGPLRRVCHHGV